jgi:hypothetical protein
VSLVALLAPALLEILGLAAPQTVCAFGAADGRVAEVRIVDRNLEMTTNGQFKVGVMVGGQALPGRVAPFATSPARDVVLRARSDRAVYLIALRDDGSAVLRYRREGSEAAEVTQRGTCSGFERQLDRWLAS